MGKTELISLIVWNFLAYICYSVIVPFLPLEFDHLGLDVIIYGYIFAMYAFALMTGALIVGKMLPIFGRKFILIAGLTSMGFAMIAFGFIVYWKSTALLIAVSLAIRGLQGFSSSMIQTTSYAIVAIVYKDNQQKYLGLLESSQGIGLVAGPAIGSGLYSLFGFQYTFYGVGGIFLILAPCLYLVIPQSVNKNDERSGSIMSNLSMHSAHNTLVDQEENADNTNSSSNNKETISVREPIKYYQVFFRPIFFITSICSFLSCFWFSYTEPVMSLRLDEFHLSSAVIGIFFSIAPFMYTISSLSVSWMADKVDSKKLILIGLVSNGLSQFMVGPSSFLPDSLIIMWFGQLFHGFTLCLFLITWLPVMIDDAVEAFPKRKIEVTNISPVIFNSMLGTGQMLGPIYGSNITNFLNFRIWTDVIGVVNLLYFVAYLLVWKGWSSKVNSQLNDSSKDETDKLLVDKSS